MGTRGGKAASAEAGGSTLKRKAASASEAGGSGLEGKQVSKSEERKILRLKSEEGKILKLKKEANAANDEAMAKLPAAYRPTPTVKAVESAAGKKKKTVLVRRLFPQEHIDALLAMPCPITPNELTEEQLADYPQSFKDLYNQEMDIAKKLRDYHQALIDQYSKYGYAVDESEAEVTDDED
jgi:hypothetical protein